MKSDAPVSTYDTGLGSLLWVLTPLLGLFVSAVLIQQFDLSKHHVVLVNSLASVVVLCVLSLAAMRWLNIDRHEAAFRVCQWSELGVSIMIALVMIPVMGLVSLGVRQLLYGESVNPQVEMVRLEGASHGEVALMFFLIGIAIPIMEEVFYRGLCLTWIARRHGNRVAIVLSALIFGIVHVDIPIAVGTALMGLVCGWLRVKTNSLLPAMSIHMVNNTVVYALMVYTDTA